ncbi:MAG: DUF2806 domain-containing protein [Methylocella sp.]
MASENGIVPVESISPIQRFLEKINLPEMIAGPAGKAISRLVAGAVEIPAAYLEAFAQSIKDKTAAKTVVSNEVAAAAAKFAVSDTDIIARAAHNLLAKEYRHQMNKEEIAKKTIDILVHETAQNAQPSLSTSAPNHELPPPEVDEDWLNVFEKYAEDASSERMQTLWARVLAGEIRNPKQFSLKTLRFVSELDQETARLFEKHLPLVCNNNFVPTIQPFSGQPFIELLHLQDSGLITGIGGNIQQSLPISEQRIAFLINQGRVILVTGPKGFVINIPCAVLTKIGVELSRIIQLPFSEVDFKTVIERIPKVGIESIALLDDPKKAVWPEPNVPSVDG